MTTRTSPGRFGALALAAAATALPLTLLTAVPASANDDDVIRRGGCSGATDWKLKASPEDGRIEVEGEIDSNRNGQEWRWRMKHNGSLTAKGTKTTRGASGSFEVRRVVVDLRGTDRLVFRAVDKRSGEVCRGTVRF
ncbi:hypothetical protein [Nocardioides caldifontis]|uniref:hypothetical protein n=1 Tax=Nocardioides caldifontis TaxID=2588938 RepID=UPI0011DF16CE|nr:hypothetical protein [Nocardioides caldifontis]